MSANADKIRAHADYHPMLAQARAIRRDVADDDATVARWLLRDWGRRYAHFVALAAQDSGESK